MGESGNADKGKKSPEINRDPSGHRLRKREKVLKSGGYVLSDLELVEMLLYYVVPQKDTTAIAGELLSRFGSIKGILDADGSAIQSVPYLKSNAEVLFILLRQVSLRDVGTVGVGDFRDPRVAREYLLQVYKDIRNESVFAIYLNGDGGMLDSEFVYRGGINSARFPLRTVTEGTLRNRGVGVIVAHNHPSGNVFPSNDDILTTDRIAAHLAATGITLVEHYIIGNGECAGIMKKAVYDK